MKSLYAASVLFLGVGLGFAQCSNSQAVAPASTTAQVARASYADAGPISRMNPVTGNNPETQQNPNAGQSSTVYRASASKKSTHSQQVSNATVTPTASGN